MPESGCCGAIQPSPSRSTSSASARSASSCLISYLSHSAPPSVLRQATAEISSGWLAAAAPRAASTAATRSPGSPLISYLARSTCARYSSVRLRPGPSGGCPSSTPARSPSRAS